MRSAIAQQDELCEQAVQSFRQVWRILGAENTPLRIVRFWGGQPNPEQSDDNVPTVVVATIQTLSARMDNARLDWLAKPGLVIVDECHHAITKTYTGLLSLLNAEAPKPGSIPKDEPPLIGLSATPFRGTQDEESKRLARRFDQNLLPRDQEALHEKLTERGILARAHYEELNIPIEKQLSDDLPSFFEFDDLDGIAAQNAATKINEYLAPDETQNEALVEFIKDNKELKSILVFARTVGHADEIAARLNTNGITAAAVNGETPSSARRHFLKKFKAGEIRVLCNWGVLTTGFDAPKVDMVLIPRVVFSPVSYMQMVGRGLRGTKNDGTESCRIVTVLVNLRQYDDKQAYHFCKKYFASR